MRTHALGLLAWAFSFWIYGGQTNPYVWKGAPLAVVLPTEADCEAVRAWTEALMQDDPRAGHVSRECRESPPATRT